MWDAKELGATGSADVKRAGPADELQADRRAYDEAWATSVPSPAVSSTPASSGSAGSGAAPHLGSRPVR